VSTAEAGAARWDPLSLAAAAARLRRAAADLEAAALSVRRLAAVIAGTEGRAWSGVASASAAEAVGRLARHAATVADGAGTLGSALSRAASDLELARRRSMAPALTAGSPNVPRLAPADDMPGTDDAAAVDRQLSRAARALLEVLVPVLRAVGSDLLASPASAQAGLPRDLAVMAPAGVAAWWAALPPGARAALLAGRPDVLGRLDGMPATVRDQANRALLIAQIADARGEIVRLRSSPGPPPGVAPYLWRQGGEQAIGRRLEELHHLLAVLESIRAAVSPPSRLLLLLDAAGSGRAVVAVGNPDVARHVAVVVPGMATGVEDDLGALVRSAGRLHDAAAAQSAGGEGSVAVLAWLGYATPSIATVLFDRKAKAAMEDLRRCLAGLRVAGRAWPAPHVTVVGHSYGSLVAGLALQGRRLADDLVLLGSPGVGLDRADDLRVPKGRVYVAEAPGDRVADTGYFGGDPSEEAFGATALSTTQAPEGQPSAATRGHSRYLDAGTASLSNVAAVVAGSEPVRATAR